MGDVIVGRVVGVVWDADGQKKATPDYYYAFYIVAEEILFSGRGTDRESALEALELAVGMELPDPSI